MSRYRSYGALDDPGPVGGDTGFVGVNQRDNPDQLQPGEVVVSKNGRIDGYWQPRKGIELKSGQLTTNALPLRMPFYVIDSNITITGATRASNVVTLTVSGGHGLSYLGEFAEATVDPVGANNTVKFTAVASGSAGNGIRIDYDPPGADEYALEIAVAGSNIDIAIGSYSNTEELVISGTSEGSVNTTLTRANAGTVGDPLGWEWTSDGLPIGGSWGSPATGRVGLYGVAGGWVLETDDGTTYNATTSIVGSEFWPRDPAFSWTVNAGSGAPTVTMDKATAQQLITQVNADPAASALVTASAVGDVSGAVQGASPATTAGASDNSGTPAYLTIGDPDVATNPLTGTDDVLPGSYEVTVTSTTEMTFSHTGADEALTIDGTYGYLNTVIDDGAITDVFGSCKYSDPSTGTSESIIFAVNTSAQMVDLSDYTRTTIPYPSGSSISGAVDLVQAFDRVFLFRDGERTWEYMPKGQAVETADYTSASGIVEIMLSSHGLTAGDEVTTADIGFVTTDPNGTHTVTTVVDEDTFQYVIATGGGDETYTANTGISTATGFVLAPAGDYTQNQSFNIAGTAATAVGGTVTFTVSSNTTIKIGDYIQVYETDVPLLMPLMGNSYKVTAATATTISFLGPIGDGTGGASEFVDFGGRFSSGSGFIRIPAPPWGVYFQRRLWCPFYYDPGGTGISPTFTDRGTRDEICVSDILDPDTFDSIEFQFRITAGEADYLVGMHPFYDDNMLVFNRNSIHIVTGTQGSLSDTVVKEMTREVGCVARRSIVSQGNNIFFLSDNGVYGMSFIDAYNLRGLDEPLSEKIQPYIDRINESLAADSVGIFFDNRYYLAVPLDSVAGAGDALGNNTVLIYNTLNKAWESVDTYANGDFLIKNFIIAQAAQRNKLYVINDQGGVHLAGSLDDGYDSYSLDITGGSNQAAIDYELQTRGYTLNNIGRKKFKRAQVQMQSSPGAASDVEFYFASEDPDADQYLVTDVASLFPESDGLPGQINAGETANCRMRLGGVRGSYGVLTIRRKIIGLTAAGRPRITSIAVEGSDTSRQTLSQY